MGSTFYSQRLGHITDDQLAAALTRFDLGTFVSAAPIASGLFGQNLFVTSTQGEFVLRGAPHWFDGKPNDDWQFAKEAYFAREVFEQTDVPVPWPQYRDTTSDIFGWPYVLMPKLAGECFTHQRFKSLGSSDQNAIAEAMANGLTRLRSAVAEAAGDIDLTLEFYAWPDGFNAHIASETLTFAATAEENGRFDIDDRDFAERIIDRQMSSGGNGPCTYVHGDYKLDNLLLKQESGRWTVCGLVDFHTSCFGDAAYDLCRQASTWLDRFPHLTRTFLHGLRAQGLSTTAETLALFVCNERIKIWEYYTRADVAADWTTGTTFRDFARAATEPLIALMFD